MLQLLQSYDLKTMGHNSAAYLHHLIEAKKIAFEDRARFYADPAFSDVWTVRQLAGKARQQDDKRKGQLPLSEE
jgi:gamma-glutamyltranspeptidase / glutathione hydrolase